MTARLEESPWNRIELPSELRRIPAMLSEEEKKYLVWTTAEAFEGWGAVVDLGPWLGGSTASLAEGLRRRGVSNKVECFDTFRWVRGYMSSHDLPDLPDDADFMHLFLQQVSPYQEWISPHRQDLSNFAWDEGPIEILFVDAAKTWTLTNSILSGFGPALVPGRSRVILQDFRHHRTHWLSLIFDSRMDVWRERETVREGWTVTFTPLKPLFGPAGIHSDYSEESFPLASADQLLRARMARETGENRHLIHRILYRKYLIEGDLAGAREVKDELIRDSYALPSLVMPADIEDVTDIVVPMGWKAYDAGDYEGARLIAENCLGDDHRPIHAVLLLGLSLLRLGDLQGARRCIDRVIEESPGDRWALLYKAEVTIAEGKLNDAENDIRMVIDSAGAGEEAIVEYGLSLLTACGSEAASSCSWKPSSRS